MPTIEMLVLWEQLAVSWACMAQVAHKASSSALVDPLSEKEADIALDVGLSSTSHGT